MNKKRPDKNKIVPVKKQADKTSAFTANENYFAILSLLIVTFIAYSPVLKAGFVNWDDQEYAYENLLIRSLSNLKEILLTPVQGNFHPLTMLSLAFNYSLSELNAWSYHLVNLLLHLSNTFFVFQLAKKLSKGNAIISVTTAMLFALHPMHVESVAWVSERKDVLYSFFYLLGLISYTNYIDSKKQIHYFFSLIWQILSLASKPAAVVFPLTLLTIDLLRGRKFTTRLFAEKIPFFILSAALGLLTIHFQSLIGTTQGQNYFGFGYRFFFGFYGFLMYIIQLIVPVNLVPFYAFPTLGKTLPVIYYLSPLFFIAVFILCFRLFKKTSVPLFGFAFYLVNLILVLQFFMVGSAIIADRYTYIPYIGIFYLIGWMIDRWKNHSSKNSLAYIVAAGIILSVMTFNQAATWRSSITLWDHAIKVNPSFRAYNNRGSVYRNDGNREKALECYNEALKLNRTDPEIFCNRGNVYSEMRKVSEALSDYNSSLALKHEYLPALANRGSLYGSIGKTDSAIIDLTKVLTKDPNYKSAYPNRATAYLDAGKYDEAVSDYTKFLQFNPNDVDIMNMIAVCYQHQKKYDESLIIFDKMLSINPKPVFYLNRSYSWNGLGKKDEARKDVITARNGGVEIPTAYAQFLGL